MLKLVIMQISYQELDGLSKNVSSSLFFLSNIGNIQHLQLKARALSSCLMVVLWLELGCWHPKGRKMNAHAHLTGQISSQMSTQSSTQVSGPSQQIGNFMASQMQGLGPGPMDSELQNGRATMQQKMWVFTLQLNYYVLSSLCNFDLAYSVMVIQLCWWLKVMDEA